MKLSFKNLMGYMPTTTGSTECEVLAVWVSICKEDRVSLSTSNKFKLSKSSISGDNNKFALYQSNGQLVNSFEIAYNLHMRVDVLNKSLEYYDMRDVFRILPEVTVSDLDQYLEKVCVRQSTERDTLREVSLNPTDNDVVAEAIIYSREVQAAERDVEAVDITPIDMMSRLQDLDELAI